MRFATQEKSQELSTLYISLSLFIILLAFFLVLTANSDFKEERVRPVLESLEQTFTTRVFETDIGPSTIKDASKASSDGMALQELAALFKSDTEGLDPQTIPSRGFLSLEVSENSFREMVKNFEAQQATNNKAALMLRALNGNSTNSKGFHLEIWLPKNSENLLTESNSLIQNLIEKNIDPARLSLGVSNQVATGKILLLFRPYKPYGIKG